MEQGGGGRGSGGETIGKMAQCQEEDLSEREEETETETETERERESWGSGPQMRYLIPP